MNVYDFDDTIYDGDSTFDFYFYCLKKKIKLIKYLPKQSLYFFLYIIGKKTKKEFKEMFFIFLNGLENIDEMIFNFWIRNETKIKKFYLDNKKENDLVISASPYFLLENICKKIGIKDLIATDMDKFTGKITGENCYGEEKVVRFRQKYKNKKINNFYTDSLSDLPLINIAKKSYIVKKQEIIDYSLYKK